MGLELKGILASEKAPTARSARKTGSVYVHMATVYISLKVYRGEKPEFSDIFGANKYYWRFLLADILYGLIVMIGFL